MRMGGEICMSRFCKYILHTTRHDKSDLREYVWVHVMHSLYKHV